MEEFIGLPLGPWILARDFYKRKSHEEREHRSEAIKVFEGLIILRKTTIPLI